MGQADRGVEIATGRRRTDGHVRVALFTHDLLALTVEENGERAPTLLLTYAQADELQRALANLLPQLARTETTPEIDPQTAWAGRERRTSGELR